jgi:hypothetical protein
MKNLYEEYAVLEAKLKDLTNKKDELRVKILEHMVVEGNDKVATGFGSFAIAKLKSWTYPEKVVKMGEDFKEAKAKAESTGDATYEEKDSLRFTPVKL